MLQVGNLKPATEIDWFKDGIEIEEDDEDAKKIGKSDEVLTFDIGKVRLGWAMMGLFLSWDSSIHTIFIMNAILLDAVLYATGFATLKTILLSDTRTHK